MAAALKCWICGRTSNDIKKIYGGDDPSIKQIKEDIKKTKKMKKDWLNAIDKWLGNIPEVFQDMDYDLFIKNPGQFKGKIDFIKELVPNHNQFSKSFEKIYLDLKDNHTSASDLKKEFPKKYEMLKEKVEKTWASRQRSIRSAAQEIKIFKLPDGVAYLRSQVEITYDNLVYQKEIELARAQRAKPNWTEVHVYDVYEKEIPLCTVCRGLIQGFPNNLKFHLHEVKGERFKTVDEEAE